MPSTSYKKFPHVTDAWQYMEDVLSDAIPACEYVRLACKRNQEDLARQNDPDYPYYFDPAKAERVCKFVEMMIFTSGKWQRQKIQLQPWQKFITVTVFGWMKRQNKMRRFRETYIAVPRKNGKSEFSAALGNYMLTADGEKGAEIYCGASTERQAWEVFKSARLMATWNEEYKSAFGLVAGAKNLSVPTTGSKFEPLIGNPGDGGKPSFAIVDEFHEHQSSNLYDTMRTGTGSREQPLVWIITTAGISTSSPCYDKQKEAEKILHGILDNQEMFALIYTIDKDDDWKDFAVWKKANPNFGISCLEDDLRSKYRDAMQLAHKQNINKCKHLNIWSNAAISWINMVKLDECIDATITPDKFKDCPCWVGLDLASRIDLTAMMLVFRLPEENSFSQFTGGRYAIFGKFYLPSETVELSENGHYRAWEAQGFLKSTPGHRIDLGYVMQDLQEIAKTYNVKELVYDPYEATRFIEEAQNVVSFPCIEMLQTPNFMSEPMKIFEEAYMSGNLLWDGNSFLRWQFSNVILKNAANKKYYPTKEKGNLKIDGPVATLMALSRASLIENAASVYETRGEFLWL